MIIKKGIKVKSHIKTRIIFWKMTFDKKKKKLHHSILRKFIPPTIIFLTLKNFKIHGGLLWNYIIFMLIYYEIQILQNISRIKSKFLLMLLNNELNIFIPILILKILFQYIYGKEKKNKKRRKLLWVICSSKSIHSY